MHFKVKAGTESACSSQWSTLGYKEMVRCALCPGYSFVMLHLRLVSNISSYPILCPDGRIIDSSLFRQICGNNQ